MSLTADVDRGAAALALLQNPLFQEAWRLVANGIHEKWEQTPIRDMEGQQLLKLQLKCLHDIKSVFELAVTDGNAAARELQRLNEDKPLSPRQWIQQVRGK